MGTRGVEVGTKGGPVGFIRVNEARISWRDSRGTYAQREGKTDECVLCGQFAEEIRRRAEVHSDIEDESHLCGLLSGLHGRKMTQSSAWRRLSV